MQPVCQLRLLVFPILVQDILRSGMLLLEVGQNSSLLQVVQLFHFFCFLLLELFTLFQNLYDDTWLCLHLRIIYSSYHVSLFVELCLRFALLLLQLNFHLVHLIL